MYLVCGEALFDLFTEECADTSSIRFDARVGGSPFNVAVGLARLEESVALLTGISTDMLGEKLQIVLDHEGVSTKYLVQTGRRTTLSLVGLDKTGSPSYSFYGVGSADCGVKFKHVPTLGDNISGLHFGSYTTVVKPVAKAFSKLAKKYKHKFISYDPNVRLTIEPNVEVWRSAVEEFAGLADLLKISKEDFDALYPNQKPESKIGEWHNMGVNLVVLTDGKKQIQAWCQSGVTASIIPPQLEIVDTVGAGDSFQAALLKCLLEMDNPKAMLAKLEKPRLLSILNFAATSAALTCTRRGADLPAMIEVNAAQQL